ncbi:hypothetical protein R1flu_013679 [Riccia fluitans]|uniref:F-box domain-containing protein n=1 Tax=Riccia fluitans TaxID=41844 RepID=A0ABD1YE32_9MARC
MERASGKKNLMDVRNHSPGRVPWAELSIDTLLEIFKRLPVKDRLRTLPQICKAWRKASFESDCWLFIDMKDWCGDLSFKFNLSPFIAAPVPARTIDRMVSLVLKRSCGGIQDLRLTHLEGDASLQILAQSGLSSLKTLCVPWSRITENGLCELVLKLPSLVHLDISYCNLVGIDALKVIGQSCNSLRRLDRLMWPVVARIWISWNDDGEDDVVDLADEFDEYDSFDFGDEDNEDYFGDEDYFDDEDDMDYGEDENDDEDDLNDDDDLD